MFEPIFLGLLLLGVPLSVQIAPTFGKQNMVCFPKKQLSRRKSIISTAGHSPSS
jgi:hypothetical protein